MEKKNSQTSDNDAQSVELGALKPITLDTPIQRGSLTITEVSVRQPGAGEMRGVAMADLLKLDVDTLITLIPRISQPTLTRHEVAALTPADLLALGSEVAGFLLNKEQQALYRNG